MRDWLRRKMPYFWLDLARLVPPRLRFWVYVQCVAEATTGIYENTVVPELPAIDVLKRLKGCPK